MVCKGIMIEMVINFIRKYYRFYMLTMKIYEDINKNQINNRKIKILNLERQSEIIDSGN